MEVEKLKLNASLGPFLMAFIVVVILISMVAILLFNEQKQRLRNHIESELRMISKIKATEVAAWYHERGSDAAVTARAPVISNFAWEAQNAKDPKAHTILSAYKRMRHVQEAYNYHSIYILNLEFEPILSTRTHLPALSEPIKKAAAQALATRQVQVTPMMSGHKPEEPEVIVDFIAPLLLDDREDAPIIGIIVLRTDPAEQLFPLLNLWPTAEISGENVLVSLEGDQVAYLNQLQNTPGAPLTIRRSLLDDLLAQALEHPDEDPVVNGTDYRGNFVLAHYQRVKGTPWYTAAKVDYRELTDPIRQHIRKFIIFTILAIGITFSFLAMWWRSRRLGEHRENEEILIHQQEKLQRALREVRKAAEEKSRFLAYLSHELKNPLNAIVGLTDILQKCDLPEKEKDLSERIRVGADILIGVFSNVIELGKIEANEFDLNAKPFQIGSCLQEVVKIVSHQAEVKKLEFEYILDKEIPTILLGDQLRLKQILINLTTNAVKFTQSGKVKVRAYMETSNRKLANSSDVCVCFEIEDTGKGMTAAQIRTLFKDFSQVDSFAIGQDRGSGLGLSICRYLVERMGGDITVKSAVGVGTTFTFCLSFQRMEAENSAEYNFENGSDYLPNFSGLRVLVVDDMEINQYVIKECLRNYGIVTIGIHDGESAVKFVKENLQSIDLILMDFHLPGINGIETAKAIRQLMPSRNLPIFALTAEALDRDSRYFSPAEFTDYISKPIDSGDLLRKISIWTFPEQHSNQKNILLHQQNDSFVNQVGSEVDFESALKRMNGNHEIYRKIMDKFQQYAINGLDEITVLVDRKDFKSAILIAHSLKSITATIGAMNLSRLISLLEKKLENGFYEQCYDLIELIRSDTIYVIDEIRGKNTRSASEKRRKIG